MILPASSLAFFEETGSDLVADKRLHLHASDVVRYVKEPPAVEDRAEDHLWVGTLTVSRKHAEAVEIFCSIGFFDRGADRDANRDVEPFFALAGKPLLPGRPAAVP
jgi:hypothetical protein